MEAHKACKDCPKRWVDTEKGTRCHSTCETYKQAVEESRRKKAWLYQNTCIVRKGDFLGDDGQHKGKLTRHYKKR